MAETRDFSVILFVALVTIWAYLLNGRVIGGWSAVGLVLASGVCAFVLGNSDRVQQLTLRRGENQVLVQMREIQEGVYAKVEELKRIAAGIAAFTTASTITENRLVDRTHQERMFRRRDYLERFLQDAGVDETRQRELLHPITAMVDWDLRRAVVVDAVAAWKVPPGTSPTDSKPRDGLQAELESALQKPDRPAALTEAEELLKKHGVRSEGLSQSINQYRQMLESGRLPRIGAADDLKNPPIDNTPAALPTPTTPARR